jgi:hypothetical protein
MREPITSKRQMYALLSAGLLGNTVPQFFSVDEWLASPEAAAYPVWGVRTLTPGGPCRLYVAREDVPAVAASLAPHAVNISLMLDAACC